MESPDKTDPGQEHIAAALEMGLTFERAVELRLAAIVKEQAEQRGTLDDIHKAVQGLGTKILSTYERRIKKLEKRVAELASGR